MRYQFWQDRNNQKKLPIVFKPDRRPAHDVYYLHWHKAVELILVKQGHVTIKNNDRTFLGRAGELYIIHSTHLHSFQMDENGAEYYCLILPNDIFPSKEFFRASLPFTTTDPDCIRLYKEAWEVYHQKPAYYEEQMIGLILQLYAKLAALGGEQMAGDDRSVNATVRRAMSYIESHYAEKLIIEDIAAAVNVSRHHLCHIFKEVTGTTPAHYWQTIRCDAAKRMLRRGASVAEAADACGFSSYPYFAKIYYQQFGVLPSEDKIK